MLNTVYIYVSLTLFLPFQARTELADRRPSRKGELPNKTALRQSEFLYILILQETNKADQVALCV